MRERQFKKFFIVYGHYDDNSFNAAIRDTFIESAKKAGDFQSDLAEARSPTSENQQKTVDFQSDLAVARSPT